tara:strand:- start:14121 stop:14570 length:450 start_codon:yes stop_codon:yes gene_type:complete
MITETDKNIILEWEDIDNLVTHIEAQVRQHHPQVGMIVGVSRGGVIPGVMLSHKLGIGFETVQWTLRDGLKKEIGRLNNITERYQCLVIDDILDSGATIEDMKADCLHPFKVATLLAKKSSEHIDIEGRKYYNNDKWIVFPWEELNNEY